jgi:hypothetical protein
MADLTLPAAPTVSDVDRIANLQDPALRNLQITQCYSELSKAFTLRTGYSANWCTFATWASKQAGQSIRKEDLRRTLERLLREPSGVRESGADLSHEALLAGANRSQDEIKASVLQSLDLRTAVDRASEAVGRGNKKVFEEIGREFARFISEFLHDAEPDSNKLAGFLATLRPGDPPDGQRYLSQAFRRYYRSFFVQDAKTRAELLLCANIEIGLHEQTRLQPEIQEALDAAFVDAVYFTRLLMAAIFPFSGWIAFSQWLLHRLLRRPTAFDLAIQALLADIQNQMRRGITEAMMAIHLPPDLTLRLGADLTAGFPDLLRKLVDPELLALLAQVDPTPDSLVDSGVLDWGNFPDRLHFIVDLFRCYQESRDLFDAPFSPAQAAKLKAGQMPSGPL